MMEVIVLLEEEFRRRGYHTHLICWPSASKAQLRITTWSFCVTVNILCNESNEDPKLFIYELSRLIAWLESPNGKCLYVHGIDELADPEFFDNVIRSIERQYKQQLSGILAIDFVLWVSRQISGIFLFFANYRINRF